MIYRAASQLYAERDAAEVMRHARCFFRCAYLPLKRTWCGAQCAIEQRCFFAYFEACRFDFAEVCRRCHLRECRRVSRARACCRRGDILSAVARRRALCACVPPPAERRCLMRVLFSRRRLAEFSLAYSFYFAFARSVTLRPRFRHGYFSRHAASQCRFSLCVVAQRHAAAAVRCRASCCAARCRLRFSREMPCLF